MTNLSLYGLRPFSETVYPIIFVGCFCYFIGTLLPVIKVKSNRIANTDDYKKSLATKEIKELVFNKKLYLLLQIVSFICVLFVFYQALLAMLSGYSFSVVRNMFKSIGDESGFINSIFLHIVWVLFVVPTVYLSIPIVMYSFFAKSRGNKALMTLSIINIVMYIISSGGRILIICCVVYLLFLAKRFNFQVTGRIKFLVLSLFVILTYSFLYITMDRSNERSVFEYVYHYTAIPIPLFSHWKAYVDNQEIITYGSAFWYGFVGFINRVTRFAGTTEIAKTTQDAIAMTEFNYIRLFPTRSYNAFVTCFYYFYLDFRYFGVVIGGLFYGFISQIVYLKAIASKDSRNFIVLLLFIQSIIFSIARWQFGEMKYFLSFAYLLIILFTAKNDSTRKVFGNEQV